MKNYNQINRILFNQSFTPKEKDDYVQSLQNKTTQSLLNYIALKEHFPKQYQELICEVWKFIEPRLDIGYVYDENRKMFDITNVFFHSSYIDQYLVYWSYGTYTLDEIYDFREDIVLSLIYQGIFEVIDSTYDEPTDDNFTILFKPDSFNATRVYENYDFSQDEFVSTLYLMFTVYVNKNTKDNLPLTASNFYIDYTNEDGELSTYNPDYDIDKINRIIDDYDPNDNYIENITEGEE